MNFSDEFEYTVKDGNTYYVSVAGEQYMEDGYYRQEVTHVIVCDSLENEIDTTHAAYNEIAEYAHEREYDVEVYDTDFDYYDTDMNAFLKEK